MLAAADQLFVAGSYTARRGQRRRAVLAAGDQHACRSASRVAVWFVRAVGIAAASLQLFVAGSYSSALVLPPPVPPATSTLPFASSVAVCW